MAKFTKVATTLAFVVAHNLALTSAVEGWQMEGCTEGQIMFWGTAMTFGFIACWWLIVNANERMEDEL